MMNSFPACLTIQNKLNFLSVGGVTPVPLLCWGCSSFTLHMISHHAPGVMLISSISAVKTNRFDFVTLYMPFVRYFLCAAESGVIPWRLLL